ncbi:MAG: NADH:ubiquinone reductase (Na(+)-transporting) subunit C [Bacteroidales bacterium]
MSNKYVFMYASVMVIVVAIVLSTASTLLDPLQQKNMRIEKMQNILSTIEISASKSEAIEMFDRYITTTKVLNSKGEEVEGDAFEIDLKEENRKPVDQRKLPLYIADVEGENFYIVPLRGTGLWGPLWGYLSFRGDLTTIAGANFDHASETPGLGAEIADEPFEVQFTGKRIFDQQGNFNPPVVVKGSAPDDDPYAVDGISGGTITSNGVTDMLRNGLEVYEPYFKKQKISML